MTDTFNGDNAALCASIAALLSLDAAGALVPHGLSGNARALLESAASRLATLAGAGPVAEVCIHDGHKYLKWTDGDYHYLNAGTQLFTHAPAKAREDWQPIATAPKSAADGSRVSGVYLLGFVPDAEMDFDPNACIDIVWWEPLLPNKAGTRGKWCRSAGDTTIECEPTHWRPLPATPVALATFAEGGTDA